MNFAVLSGLCSFLCIGLFICAFYLQRFRYERNKPLERKRFGFHPAFLGNALQPLQCIVQPQAEYFLEEKLADEADEVQDGEPENMTRHLHRQLKRIRNGEEIDPLTALLPGRR